MARQGRSNGDAIFMVLLIAAGLLSIYFAYRYGWLQVGAKWLVSIASPNWH